MKFFSKSAIGIDLQYDKLIIIHLEKTRGQIELKHANQFSLHASPCVSDANIPWEKISHLLREWVQEKGLQGRPCYLLLPASLVNTQHLQLPAGLTRALLCAEMKAHIEREGAYMAEQFIFDYHTYAAKNSAYQDVYLAFVRKEIVAHYSQCVRNAKLRVKSLDMEDYALWYFVRKELGNSQALLHVDTCKLKLFIFDERKIHFQQTWMLTSSPPILEILNLYRRLTVSGEERLVCSGNVSFLSSCVDLQEVSPLHIVQPFSNIRLSSELQQSLSLEQCSDFYAACGAGILGI